MFGDNKPSHVQIIPGTSEHRLLIVAVRSAVSWLLSGLKVFLVHVDVGGESSGNIVECFDHPMGLCHFNSLPPLPVVGHFGWLHLVA